MSIIAALLPGDNEIDDMPSSWVWTNRRLGTGGSNVYLVYPSELADARLGAMKVFRPQTDLEAEYVKRELLALQALASESPFAL